MNTIEKLNLALQRLEEAQQKLAVAMQYVQEVKAAILAGGDDDTPGDAEVVPLKGYRWEVSDNRNYMGQALLLPPKVLTGKVKSVNVNGKAFERHGEHAGRECWYGPPPHTFKSPIKIQVIKYIGTIYEATIGGQPASGGWGIPAGYRAANNDDTKDNAHWNPKGWGIDPAFVGTEKTRSGNMFIHQKGKPPIKADRKQMDKDRRVWRWTKVESKELADLIYLSHDVEKIVYRIKPSSKKAYRGSLLGSIP